MLFFLGTGASLYVFNEVLLILPFLFESQLILTRAFPDIDDASFFQFTLHQQLADSIFYIGLDGTLQWTSTKLYILSLLGN